MNLFQALLATLFTIILLSLEGYSQGTGASEEMMKSLFKSIHRRAFEGEFRREDYSKMSRQQMADLWKSIAHNAMVKSNSTHSFVERTDRNVGRQYICEYNGLTFICHIDDVTGATNFTETDFDDVVVGTDDSLIDNYAESADTAGVVPRGAYYGSYSHGSVTAYVDLNVPRSISGNSLSAVVGTVGNDIDNAHSTDGFRTYDVTVSLAGATVAIFSYTFRPV